MSKACAQFLLATNPYILLPKSRCLPKIVYNVEKRGKFKFKRFIQEFRLRTRPRMSRIKIETYEFQKKDTKRSKLKDEILQNWLHAMFAHNSYEKSHFADLIVYGI